MSTLTSANSSFLLMATTVFPAPQVLEGYATDDAFTSDVIELAEVVMGVDGRMSAGYVPNPSPMTIVLQADSPSIAIFDTLIGGTKVAKEVIFLDGIIRLPATGKSYSLTRGVLKSANQMPGAKKTLQPHTYVIVWQNIDVAVS